MIVTNPQEKAVAIANKDIDRLGVLFAKVGDKDHLDTPIFRSYRNTHRALAQVLRTTKNVKSAKEVMAGLLETTDAQVDKILREAVHAGVNSAYNQMKVYGVDPPTPLPEDPQGVEKKIKAAKKIVMDKVVAQDNSIQGLMLAGMPAPSILGDENRVGVLRPYDVAVAAAFWIAAMFAYGFSEYTGTSDMAWQKQAIAALDERTTRTCLAVHGQVVPLNGEFHLTEEPRFADYLPNPPFHHRCRTATALYLPQYDYGFTNIMRLSANQILAERATGGTGYRHPADAFA